MQKLNCLIVEDEPLASDILKDYISQVPFLHLAAVASNALEALNLLKTEKIDALFLDIHLPRMKGLDMLRTLKSPPQVILTTAFREYALDGFDLNVVDYLLKPIRFERFIAAVNKLRDPSTETVSVPVAVSLPERTSILINVNKKRIRIFTDEIIYVESKKEYVSIVTKQGKYLTKYPISELEQELDKQKFIRVHRSFLVARSAIRSFNAVEIDLNGEIIPIGRSYKELVMASLSTL